MLPGVLLSLICLGTQHNCYLIIACCYHHHHDQRCHHRCYAQCCDESIWRVLWKRLNTESDPKKTETSPKWIFLRRFLFFQKLSEIPQIQFLEEFPVFFCSSIFRSDSGLSGSNIVEEFPNIFEGFPNIFDPFPHFLGPFPVFIKSCKFSVCGSVSPFFGSVSSFFGSVSDFQKKL